MIEQPSDLAQLLQIGEPASASRPWPRGTVDASTWHMLAQGLARGDWILIGLWGDAGSVHMALGDPAGGPKGIATFLCRGGRYPSVARLHLPALRLERTIADMFGFTPEGIPDSRPWLDHGRWPVRHPLGESAPPGSALPYQFLPVEGESLHQIPVGPVHAGIIEPGHFRFTANGETVARLEQRLGYVHKGTESLMTGAPLDLAARLAGRVSGDSTVAYALAFARAVEAATGADVPARANWLRALMAELERVANHFGDIGAISNDASFALMHTHCGMLREQVLRAAESCFGHRLMMDRVVPGGVAADLMPGGATRLRALIAEIRAKFPELIELYDNTASLQDRTVATGIVSAALARQFGCGGFVARASGCARDARRAPGYPPYDALNFTVPVLTEGDVNARVWVRIREVEQSIHLLEQILDRLPAGPIRNEIGASRDDRAMEGAAFVEGFRGDIFAWLRLGPSETVERCHLRDPSWFQWPLLEVAIKDNIVADFPLCNKSFNCSYSGHDL